MDSEHYEKLLTKLHRLDLPWQTSKRHGAEVNERLRWMQVVNIKVARISLGISYDGWWVVQGPITVVEFRPETSLIFLLPVLEIEMRQAQSLMSEGLKEAGLPSELVSTFPFEEVVFTGLESLSEQWATLALPWAEELQASPKLLGALQVLAAKGRTQRLRHAAQKACASKRREAAR